MHNYDNIRVLYSVSIEGGIKMKDCNHDRRCNFCLLLRRGFIGEFVSLFLDCGVNDISIVRGFVQPSSFEDDVIKLFSQSSGGEVTATAYCKDIVLIDFLVDETVAMVQSSSMKENINWYYNSDTCDFCSGLLMRFLGRQVTLVIRGVNAATAGVISDIFGDFVEIQVTEVRRNIICCHDICAVIAPV